MTETEKEVPATLVDLEQKVAQMKAGGPKPDLISIFNKLDGLTAQLPKDTEPDLLHYLHRKSYEKARLFLQGREAENERGSCRH